MWYVVCEDGIYGDYEDLNEAEEVCGRLNASGEDAWIASDNEDFEDEIEDCDNWDFEVGYTPYPNGYDYDC